MTDEACIYVVIGETGEYSDHSLWHVRAFDVEDEADAFAKRLNDRAESLGISESLGYFNLEQEEKVQAIEDMKDLDPECWADYTGVGYGVISVPLELANDNG